MANMNRIDPKAVPVFLLAVWFGLGFGLLEGVTYLIFEYAGWVSWQTDLRAVDQNILWASTMMDLVVCLSLACLLKPMIRLLGRHALAVVVGVFASVGFYAFLSFSGRLSESGALVAALGLGTATSRWVTRDAERRMRIVSRTMAPLAATAAVVCLGVIFGVPVWEKLEYSRLPAPPGKAPNVLLIVLDTLRSDRLGSYGYKLPTTPFLDRYSRESVLFEKAFANAPWTLPSHVSIFTGTLPSAHGATSARYDGRFPTLAQEMSKNGYATAGIVANGSFGSRAHGFARGFIHWENGFDDLFDAGGRTALGRRINRYAQRWLGVRGLVGHIFAAEVNRECLRWLDSRPGRPFFLFLNYMDVHDPLIPPRKFAEKFSSEPDVISPPLGSARKLPEGESKSFDYPHMNQAYDASLASLDEQLEKLFDELRRRNLERDTLVIIASDHGESLGQHGLPGHSTSVYREQIQVPLLVRLPGVTPAGLRVAESAGLENLPATIAELTALRDSPFPGISLARWWRGSPPEERMVVSEVERPQVASLPKHWPISQGWVKSVSDDHWHFILQEHGKKELFNLDSDAGEERNLAELPESQARLAEMQSQLERLLGRGLPKRADANQR